MPNKDSKRIDRADYVIVGAGSAGCVLANRLSANGRHRVALLEAGGDDRPTREPGQFLSNMMIHIPVGYAHTLKDRAVNWMYVTEEDESSGGRRFIWPRGKVLGGSSSINGLLYIRGQNADFDGWRDLGCDGWGSDDVARYFKRAEDNSRGESDVHGVGGPLSVSDPTADNAVSQAVVDACKAMGLPERDPNGPEQEGVSWLQLTVRDGRRCSTAVGYLHPAMSRPNLSVMTRCQATRVLMEDGRAVGVEYMQGGALRTIYADGEVILAGGTINSPQLLQLSGIGPGALLQEHGVEVRRDCADVGENMQDHFIVAQNFRLVPGTLSINELTQGLRLVREAITYATSRRGVLTLSAAHVGVFCKSRPELATPDIQFHVLPATVDHEAFAKEQKMKLESLPGLSLAPCQLRPNSRGSVHLRSADPLAAPAIRPNYLSDPTDHDVIVKGLKIGREMAATAPLAQYIDHEFLPGPGVATDAALLDFARQNGTSLYHPVGTCRMGADDGAVVDPQLRVRGVDGLRVVDASVMPRIVSGNTNAATIMIAEKASDLILTS